MRRPSSLLAIFALLAGLTVAFGPSVAPASDPDPDVPRASSGTGVLPNFDADGHLVRLQAGAFDPLAETPPSVEGIPTVSDDDLVPRIPVYWLGQVEAGDFARARTAIEGAGAAIAGTIPDDTYVFRATPAQRAEIDGSAALRWTGLFQPAWRIPVAANGRSGLLDLDGTLDLKVWGFRDDPDLGGLGDRLAALGGVEVVEDARWVVHVRATAAEVPAIANIPSVQWIGQKAEAVPLNAQARWVNDTGVRDVYAATKRLTGAGQTSAAADTALNYAPDLNGRHHAAFDDCAPGYLEPPTEGGDDDVATATPNVPVAYDFDADGQGWTATAEGTTPPQSEWSWSGTNGDGNGGWAVSPYHDEDRALLTAPAPVVFEPGKQPTVTFRLNIDLENGFDYLNVEYRVGGSGGFTVAERFTGNEGEWKTVTIDDLDPSIAEQEVLFRFVMNSDELVSSPAGGLGVAIDDVSFTSGAAVTPDPEPDPEPEGGATGLVEDCKLADYTQAQAGSDTSSMHNVIDNRGAHGHGAHRKMAAYFDLGGAGRSPRDDSAHGSHVAGSIAADYGANGSPDGEDGMAPGARHVHQNISTPSGGLGGLPADDYQLWRQVYRPRDPGSVPNHSWSPSDYDNYVATEDARTHNNSYGLIVDTVDDGSAIALDEFVWHHEDMVIVASAGNSGPAPGSTGAPSVAKNDFTSGASANGRQPMASIDSMASFSSHGPTGDGRLGVDLTTPGQTVISTKGGSSDEDHYLQGTSMSGPILTGLATLVREYFHEGWGPAEGRGFAVGVEDPDARRHNPSAALVKAALVNGAERMRGYYTGDDGTQRRMDGQWPSWGQGFGLVNLDNSLYFADDPINNFYHDVWRADDDAFAVSETGAEETFTFDVQAGEPLDVTLAWTDAPNLLPAGTPALVNDLDLEVTGPGGTTFFGNNHNTRTDPSADQATAEEGLPDNRNPVERVRIAEPDAGLYTVTVRATRVQEGPQGWALSASGLIDDGADTPAVTFAPGDPLQVDDGVDGPTIDEGSIEFDRHSADTSIIRFSTDEPTTAKAVLDDPGTAEDEALEFVDVYNRSDGSRFTEHYDTGTVETSEVYADRPVVGTEHEILVFGLDPGVTYDVRLEVEDLAVNTGSAETRFTNVSAAFQPTASDIGQLTEGTPGGWQTGTQLYAGKSAGTGLLGAYMFRLPETVDPDEIVGASVEMTGMHVLSSLYDAEPTLTLDLLEPSVEPDWGTQEYEQIEEAGADARVLPETQVLEGAQARHVFDFACTDLDALRSTLEASDGERRAAFRIDSVVDAATSLPSYEFGFNRRSRGPEHRPRLILHTASDPQPGATGACDPSTPAPQIDDVAVAPGLEQNSAVVSWDTDVPSDSTVIFRERGATDWIQVGSPVLTEDHQVQVRGVDPGKRYEFGVRSTACNGASTTADNGGAGWDFSHAPVAADEFFFHGDGDDQLAKDATFDAEPPEDDSAAQQTAFYFASTDTAEDQDAAFFTGPYTGTFDGTDLTIEWWWSSQDPAAAAFGQDLEITVWSDPDSADGATKIGSAQLGVDLGSAPVRNTHTVKVTGEVAEELVIQANPFYTIPGSASGIQVHYDATSMPSGFSYPTETPPDLPLVGPVPPPDAGADGLDLSSVETRAIATAADLEAGTATGCPIPRLSIDDVTVTEGADDVATLAVSLAPVDDERTVTVEYGSSGGTVTPGADHQAVRGTLEFAPGDGVATIDVPILDDAEHEDDETVEITLSDPTNAVIADATGIVTIVDDDPAPTGSESPSDGSSPGTDTGSGGHQGVSRLSGADRWATAIDISRDRFTDGSAGVVVLARGDDGDNDDGYADALAGTPLAIGFGAPLLITPPGELRPEVEAEIRRVLGSSGRVVLLGGTVALDEEVEQRIQEIGYPTARLAGADRIGTALEIADAIDRSPGAILVTRGWEFPDALASGPAAAQVGGVILLNGDDSRHPAVEAYLDDHPGVAVHAIGGHMARLFPEANPVWGDDRFETAVEVAEGFFDAPTVAGLARSDTFPDSLSGGAHVGLAGGPMLLTPPPHLEPPGHLHPATEVYVCEEHTRLESGYVYGGVLAVTDDARDAFADRIRGTGC